MRGIPSDPCLTIRAIYRQAIRARARNGFGWGLLFKGMSMRTADDLSQPSGSARVYIRLPMENVSKKKQYAKSSTAKSSIGNSE